MSFGVGDLVECVDASNAAGCAWAPGEELSEGVIYTIYKTGIADDGVPGVKLVEVRRQNVCGYEWYNARRFRPFRPKHIEVLRKIVADVFDGVKA
jgi:hypothetical protein